MVTCGWEWTREVPWRKKFQVAERALAGEFSNLMQHHQDHMAQVFDHGSTWLGFRRLFSSSPIWIIHPRLAPATWVDRLEGHLSWLAKQGDIHIIHVVRSDSLDWLKSVYVARMAKSYVGKPYPKGIKVRIPIRKAVARLRSKNWVDSRLATLANSNPYLQIKYEDFLTNQNGVTGLLLRSLGCNPAIMNTEERRIFKQSKGQAADYVLNYVDLFERLERLDLLTSCLASL
jgi:hypothetical protein